MRFRKIFIKFVENFKVPARSISGNYSLLYLLKRNEKRVCRHRCHMCKTNFETWRRSSVHLKSRGHLTKESRHLKKISDW